MKPDIQQLRKHYLLNPPDGISPDEIRSMSDEELLDMDYFLNEDNLFDDENDSEVFFF